MSRYRGPKLRITRRLGKLPGLTQKTSKKTARPGQHGKALEGGKTKTTEYGIRLEEKQKLKFNYGISESQLYHYIKEARRRNGVTGLILLQLLSDGCATAASPRDLRLTHDRRNLPAPFLPVTVGSVDFPIEKGGIMCFF